MCVLALRVNTFHYTTLISRWELSPLLLQYKNINTIVGSNHVKLFFRYKIIVLFFSFFLIPAAVLLLFSHAGVRTEQLSHGFWGQVELFDSERMAAFETYLS